MTENELKYAPAHILWVDIETTGLDENADGAAILEIALVLTKGDAELTELASYQACIHPTQPFHMNQHVLKMHTESGLLKEIADEGKGESVVRSELCRFFQQCDTNIDLSKTCLGGSSVHFDRRWLAKFMPWMFTGAWQTILPVTMPEQIIKPHKLSYRLFDVTPLRMAYEMFRGESLDDIAPTLAEGEGPSHRALDDIMYSIAIARAFAKQIKNNPEEVDERSWSDTL